MSLYGKLMALFPALHTSLVLASFVLFVFEPSLSSLLTIPATVYLFPLLVFRIHQILAPLEEGTYSIVQGYSAWYGTHMIQTFFISFTGAERFLRMFPGLFSLWLRLWGSKVGKAVYWTPHFELADRGMLVIGNQAVFGYGVKISCHVISPCKELGLKNYIKKVEIGNGSFVGAASRLAPGVIVKDGAMVKATIDVYPDTVVEKK